MTDSLSLEVEKFKRWAAAYSPVHRSAEWECYYLGWGELYQSFSNYLESHLPESATEQKKSDLIYAVARDNESEVLAEELSKHLQWFRALLPEVLICDEPDTKWQFAVMLGEGVLPFAEAEPALLALVVDEDEYVSRRALQALGKIGSSRTEELCERAWKTEHEYQRIMVLWVLKDINSSKLPFFLNKAKEDGRKYIVSNALEIEEAQLQDCIGPS